MINETVVDINLRYTTKQLDELETGALVELLNELTLQVNQITDYIEKRLEK